MNRPADRIDVLVIDDHALFREALTALLAGAPGFTVRAVASGSEALDAPPPAAPGVVLLDAQIPGERAADTLCRLRDRQPSVPVVILSAFDDPRTVRETLYLGAAGYLVKTVTSEELVATIHNICADHERTMLSISRQSLARITVRGSADPLSRREIEVLSLVADAMTNAQIAARLSITQGTVKRHLRNIFAKLDAVSRIDAVNKATEAAIIPPHARGSAHPRPDRDLRGTER